ncbi:MAG: GNAT family N-acetyltransferase [Phycisphaera sp.]|nr:GNAT family N-acetyltransferase [Phycisphaera sp.]
MPANKAKAKTRQATLNDIDELVQLNRAAYPTLAEDNIVWGRSHLESHLRIFPEGQIVAVVGQRIVGACSSLIVNLGPEPLRFHTWAGITDSGYFTNHDPTGDTLYGADVYVHPEARGLGVGHALYEARRKLCQRLNLRRILAGGRLWNYQDHGDKFTAEEYARRVELGEFRDLVLSFQLREGFVLRGVMPNYLRDPHSKNYASLIEWLNPDYKHPGKGPRKVRVACVQKQMRKVKDFDDFANRVAYFTDIAADYRCDFVLFPEFFTVPLLSCEQVRSPVEGIKRLATHTHKFRKLVTSLAKKYGITIIAGSHPVKMDGQIDNVAIVCLPDGRSVDQPKIHITPNEKKWWGITGGKGLHVIETPKAKIGVLICYDVEFPEAARYLADEGIEILFVPFCTDNRQGYLRVRYCAQARAIENQIYVAIAGNVGNLPDVENMDINYAQSAVFTPSDFAFPRDGIAAEADSNEETVLICDLDLDALHTSRSMGTVTPRLDRRPDLFKITTSLPTSLGSIDRPDEGPLGDQPTDRGNSG